MAEPRWRVRLGAADLLVSREVVAVSGFAGMAAWTGGLGFSLLVGALADTLGYGPLFGGLGVLDLVGAAALIVLIGGEVEVDRIAPPEARSPTR